MAQLSVGANRLVNGASDKVFLKGIGCPEKGQVYSQCTKQATAALVYGKEVTLQAHDKEKCGCTTGDVLLPDDTNVNHTLVKDGWYVIVRWVWRVGKNGKTRMGGVLALERKRTSICSPPLRES